MLILNTVPGLNGAFENIKTPNSFLMVFKTRLSADEVSLLFSILHNNGGEIGSGKRPKATPCWSLSTVGQDLDTFYKTVYLLVHSVSPIGVCNVSQVTKLALF